jgi:hypothetical protein
MESSGWHINQSNARSVKPLALLQQLKILRTCPEDDALGATA